MFLRKINLKGLGPKLIISSTLLLLCSVTVVSSIIYLLLAKSLRDSDQELLKQLSESYAQTYLEHGPESLAKEISNGLIVIIASPSEKNVFTKVTEDIEEELDGKNEIHALKTEISKLPLREGVRTVFLNTNEKENDLSERLELKLKTLASKKDWDNVLPMIDNDLFEVYVHKLKSGEWIKVGRSAESREEHLGKIRFIALMVFIPFIFIGMGLSFLLSRSVLRPIRDLASTIRAIKEGKAQTRGKVWGTGDEVDTLTMEFNSMLEKNELLLQNIKSTVDNVAHDLRTPLTRLRGSAEYALTHSLGPDQLRESLADVMENSEQILNLLNVIMDVSEAESQTLKIKNETIEVSSLVDRLADFFSLVAEEKGIKFHITSAPDLYIKGDRTRLMQALGNILDNAIKYSPSNSPIEIQTYQTGENVVIAITDHGYGIEKADQEKIWERLYRGDQSRSTPGLGIGLSLVKAIVQVHHGEVTVKSQIGQGSTFFVSLPICNVQERSL